ncbi:MAG: hypothetical protein K8U57_32920 [Planctomycetes bacterium]|nr:hypothetical protein [Planctomycetota bacterium]
MWNGVVAVFVTASMVLVSEASSFGGLPDVPMDEEITTHIIGKWAIDEVGELGLKVKGTAHYHKDGTFDGQAVIGTGDDPAKIKLTGTWKVAKGVIVSTVTKSSLPAVIAKGVTYRFQVISIDDEMLRYKNEADKEVVRKRQKE